MKFKSSALPAKAAGQANFGPTLVVPNQAMPLQEILMRFTRNEELAIGKQGVYDEDSDDDLEKVARMDLVDQQEFIEKQKEVQTRFKRQEKLREEKEREAARKRIEEEERAKAKASQAVPAE